jgi:hypothetical protein
MRQNDAPRIQFWYHLQRIRLLHDRQKQMRFPKPCLECGKITTGASRCEEHETERWEIINATRNQRNRFTPKRKGTHYGGDYGKRAEIVRRTAVICHLCGDTYRANDPWTADHLIAGDPNSPLAPAHRSCNSRRGNKPLT